MWIFVSLVFLCSDFDLSAGTPDPEALKRCMGANGDVLGRGGSALKKDYKLVMLAAADHFPVKLYQKSWVRKVMA